ncbi:MAG: DedA family protein [Myxococcales bacterium]|jgi:membrane protein DedA with SNARE-associated domain|nr:DedA family protein [Myxococcales bacterium]
MGILIDFLNYISPYGIYSYFIMLGVLMACGFGLPMPEDIVLISGGILAARGICRFEIVLAVCMAGVLIGDGSIYFIGRKLGERVRTAWIFKRVVRGNMDEKVARAFAKYGSKIIFVARFMPGLRMPIFMFSGIYKVKPQVFFGLDGFAALISVPLWIFVGKFFGENLELLEQKMRQFQYGMYGVIVAILLILVAASILKKRILSKI